ncbi:hypothetical protein IK7_02116 [Bacillus cereus VD156]|nr:hypothetical protein IK7_02116 [Bacillus cereus VD156]
MSNETPYYNICLSYLKVQGILQNSYFVKGPLNLYTKIAGN